MSDLGGIMRGRYVLMLLMFAATVAGQGPERGAAPLPASPTVATMPTFKAVNGPGTMFAALHPMPPDEDLAHFKYVTKEYFVSGIAEGQPYTTRLVVRRPADPKSSADCRRGADAPDWQRLDVLLPSFLPDD
jgi:hypothetical protein